MALRIAIFGQGAFGRDVLEGVLAAGHEVVGVHVRPDVDRERRPDPLAQAARERGIPLFRYRRYRRGGRAIPEIVEEYRKLGAELNLMPYTTVILPPEIVDAPRNRSLCFHPSLLPRYRGGSAIPWQIILGERETGVTVFQPDAGVDTGPIVVQRGGVPIEDTDTAGSLYFEKLYPLGLEAMAEAVELVDRGVARPVPQDERLASFQPLLDDAAAGIEWDRPAVELSRLIRGCDPSPGAHARWRGQPIRLFGARLLPGPPPPGARPGEVLGIEAGRLVVAARDGRIGVDRVRLGSGGKEPAADAGIATGETLDPAESG